VIARRIFFVFQAIVNRLPPSSVSRDSILGLRLLQANKIRRFLIYPSSRPLGLNAGVAPAACKNSSFPPTISRHQKAATSLPPLPLLRITGECYSPIIEIFISYARFFKTEEMNMTSDNYSACL
jgi:hypothetical protein